MLTTEATIPVIDFETTGAVPGYPEEPWQVGVVLLRHGRVAADSTFSRLLHVGDRPFNPHAPGRHATLRQALRQAPSLHDLWPELRNHLQGDALAAHNVATEKKFLTRAFPLHRAPMWIDTLKLVRTAYPHLRSCKLTDVTGALGLDPRVSALAPGLQPHDALYDAVACAVLLEHLLAQPRWESIPLSTLARTRPQ